MRVAFSTGRPAHVTLPANLMAARGHDVTLYTAAYRSRFPALDARVRLRWVPQLVPSFHFLTGVQLPRPIQRADTALYDRMVGMRMEPFDLFWGWATGALASGRAARRRGARFVLDRACPHVDAQQRLVQEECERLGVAYKPEPAWFRERQLTEYEEADLIVVPSEYSRRSFPVEMQAKVLVAPLFGRLPNPRTLRTHRQPGAPFTFGTVGGQPLRKGFSYLLEAFDKYKLNETKLLLRTDAHLNHFPELRNRLGRLRNVEVVGYVDDMSDFYARCDAFVFPTLDDGFGMALIEAMAHGLPAIATDHCGAAELLTPEQDFLMVPARNAEALAGAMARLYSSQELRESLRRNALEALKRIRGEEEYFLYGRALDQMMQRAGASASR